MKKTLWLVPLLALALIGCKDPYGASEKAAADIGTGIAAGMKTVDQLRVAGIVSVQEETNVLGYLKFANDANGAFGTCAQAAHTAGSKAGSFTACAQVFSLTLNNPTELALIHVGNSQAEANITTIVNGVTAGVSAILAALGGA
jgi:hypothetical protein